MADYCFACGKKMGVFEYGLSPIPGKHLLCDKCYDKIREETLAYRTAIGNRNGQGGEIVASLHNDYTNAVKNSGFSPDVQQALIEDGNEMLRSSGVNSKERNMSSSKGERIAAANSSSAIYIIEPEQTQSTSAAATFCGIIGVIVLIAGLFVAVSTGNTLSQISNYAYGSQKNELSVIVSFFVTFIPYFLCGSVLLCLSELLSNVKSIATSLQGLRVIENKNMAHSDTSNPGMVNNVPLHNNVPVMVNSQETPMMNAQNENMGPKQFAPGNADFKQCPKCQSNIPVNAEYCYHCGTVFPKNGFWG